MTFGKTSCRRGDPTTGGFLPSPFPLWAAGVRDEVWNPNHEHISAELTPSIGRIVCDKVFPVSVSAGRVGAHQRKAGSARHLILETVNDASSS